MIILFSPLLTQNEDLENTLELAMNLLDRLDKNEEGITAEEVEAAIVDLEEMMFQTSELNHFDSIFNLN